MLLLVDQDPDFLELAERLLDTGRGVFLALNAEQAKDLVRGVGAMFSIALINIDLPGQDGFALICEMGERFPDLPVIAIGGNCPPDVLEGAKLVGAAETLRKPITPAWKAAIARVEAGIVNC